MEYKTILDQDVIDDKSWSRVMATYGQNKNRPDLFSPHFKSIYSQRGEDGILQFLFSKIGTINKYYVEFGAGDGTSCSNTRNLRENGWSGLLLEAFYPERPDINMHKEIITAENIESLFAKYNVPQKFDLLSIDIDGNDYWVWKKITNYFPSVVIIETNVATHNDYPMTIEYNPDHKWDVSRYYGANLFAMCKLAREKGYRLATTVCWNAIFIREEFFDKLELEKLSVEEEVEKYYKPEPNAYKWGRKGNRKWILV